ncbi:MAG: hypothetical protein O2960_14610 [Verrucomicrobia bacterium]|nr:hypothetical protein [Verrucomicrobiota bacterium]
MTSKTGALHIYRNLRILLHTLRPSNPLRTGTVRGPPAHFNSTDNSDMHRFATFGRSSSVNASFATASILVRLDGTARRLQTANTKKVVATFKDEHGNAVCGSKFIEIHFQDGKVVGMGNEFGRGRAHSSTGER